MLAGLGFVVNGIQEVKSSILSVSTKLKRTKTLVLVLFFCVLGVFC